MVATRVNGGRSPAWLGPTMVAIGLVAWGGAGASAHVEPEPSEHVETQPVTQEEAETEDVVIVSDDVAPPHAPPEADGQPPVVDVCAPVVELNFAPGESEVARAASLDVVERAAREFPDHTIVVEGYASAEGSATANLQLSHRRAKRAKRKLVARGVGADRISVQAFGEYRPNLDGDAERDRRVVVKIEGVATCPDEVAEE